MWSTTLHCITPRGKEICRKTQEPTSSGEVEKPLLAGVPRCRAFQVIEFCNKKSTRPVSVPPRTNFRMQRANGKSQRRHEVEGIKGTGPVRMTDSVQNLLLDLRLKSENTEEAPSPPILRVLVPGVASAASCDGTCRSTGREDERGRASRNHQKPAK
jgi:hypothetical protein